MSEGKITKPALIGGVLVGILSVFPFLSYLNLFCCLWVILGGILASNLYVKNSSSMVTLGRGVTLGLATGLIGAAVALLFTIPLTFIVLRTTNFEERIGQLINQALRISAENKMQLSPLHLGTILLFGGLGCFVLFGLFGMLGGAIGVALFEKRKSDTDAPDPKRGSG